MTGEDASDGSYGMDDQFDAIMQRMKNMTGEDWARVDREVAEAMAAQQPLTPEQGFLGLYQLAIGLDSASKALEAMAEGPDAGWASFIHRLVGRHLIYFTPVDWHVVSTVLRPECDPLSRMFDIHDEGLLAGGKPYETAIIMPGSNYTALQPVGPDQESALRQHQVFLALQSDGALAVVNMGVTRRQPEQVASDLTTRLDHQGDRLRHLGDRP